MRDMTGARRERRAPAWCGVGGNRASLSLHNARRDSRSSCKLQRFGTRCPAQNLSSTTLTHHEGRGCASACGFGQPLATRKGHAKDHERSLALVLRLGCEQASSNRLALGAYSRPCHVFGPSQRGASADPRRAFPCLAAPQPESERGCTSSILLPEASALFSQAIPRRIMKPKPVKKALTFGDVIESAYGAYGRRKGTGFVRLAVNSRVLDFRGRQRFVIWEK